MSAPTFPKRQALIGAVFLLCVIALCFFGADGSFASEQYASDYEGTSGSAFRVGVFLVLVLIAILPVILFFFSFPTHVKLTALSDWKVKGEMAKVIRSTKDTRKRLFVLSLIAFGGIILNPIITSILSWMGLLRSDIVSLSFMLTMFIFLTALFSPMFVAQSAHALIFDNGKIWYKTHMKLRYLKFNVSDIESVEVGTFLGKFNTSTIYFKERMPTRLFWLFFPPELREYLLEQGVSIVSKNKKKEAHE